ncbi:MAG: putative HNHc nuclease [Bacillota bacterium]
MKLKGEINNVNLRKGGVKVTIFLETEKRGKTLEHFGNFVDKPINFEILVDKEKILDEQKKLSSEQRKKAYALIKDFGKEYGESPDLMKQHLKTWFVGQSKYEMFSLSDCSKELANDFIEYIIKKGAEQGYEFAVKETSTMIETTMKLNIENETCSSCGEDGIVRQNKQGKKICLCDNCLDQMSEQGVKKFMKGKHLKLVE